MIGIFDSGIGGLSLYKKAKAKMPSMGFIYFSDDTNFPYGKKTEQAILNLSRKNVKMLQEKGAKAILIACNSATVSSVAKLREEFSIPIVGVEPGVKVANNIFAGKKSVVLATSLTTKTHAISKKNEYARAKIVNASKLVDLIEYNFPDIKRDDIKNILDSKIKNEEIVVLGCTHYHLIQDLLQEIYPDKIFVAPEDAIVKQLGKFVVISGESSDDIFLTSGDLAHFKVKLEAVLGRECDVRKV